ncbi:hypothetical protein GGX14DRAFT_554733 [Mycena pura]|uniref:Uncharacterized protein n=1 Tax=Mycena pura TaxID=153505 RepID=A0AAD7E4M8_9AGAR|nr:hypothetical protein GGX14DRAFT_554733 [Mycena pura]
MALFTTNRIRSAATGKWRWCFASHTSRRYLFPSFAALSILAVSGLILTMHHRLDWQLLTQTQEEALLIFCFGMFWMSVLLAWRALRAHGGGGAGVPGGSAEIYEARRQGTVRGAGMGSSRQLRPYPCSIDDAYCIVEEYTFF